MITLGLVDCWIPSFKEGLGGGGHGTLNDMPSHSSQQLHRILPWLFVVLPSSGTAQGYRWGKIRGGPPSIQSWSHPPCWIQNFLCVCFKTTYAPAGYTSPTTLWVSLINSLIPWMNFGGITLWFAIGTIVGGVKIIYVFLREGILSAYRQTIAREFLASKWNCSNC